MTAIPTDAELARSLDEFFTSAHAEVNGVRLHYVSGGSGPPLVLLGGWPQTWWQFHKIMPELARNYHVIAVDIRGMGGSDKPESGYDKRTMAADIRALARRLGYDSVHVAGHDIGAMVAYALAANHPEAVRRVALLDVAHPDGNWENFTLLPGPGQQPNREEGMTLAIDSVFLWWFAFNQVEGLPEQLLAGRERVLIDWLFRYQSKDPSRIGERDRDIYARAYSTPEALRAGNAWYQTFTRDIADQREYEPISAPLLGLGASGNYRVLNTVLPSKGHDVRVVEIPDSGHYIPEENPEAVIEHLTAFFQ